MAGHGFRRTDGNFFGARTENAFQRFGFDGVADGRGSSVRVDVADVVRRNVAVFQRGKRHAIAAIAVFGGLRDVVGVAGHSVADNFRENCCAAALRVFKRLQNHHAGTLADDESIAIGVERPAGVLGIVIARRESAHGRESADAHGRDGGFGAPGDHHVCGAALNNFEGVTDGVRGSGAGRGGGGVRAFRAVTNGNVSGGEIDDGGGNKERRDLAGTARQKFGMLALNDVESTDAGADVDAGRIRNFRSDLQAGHLHGEIGGGESELNKAPGFLQLFFLQPMQRVKIADFAGDAAIKGRGVKMGDGANAALAGQQIAPDFFGANAAAANQSNARNDNTTIQRELLLYGMGRRASALLALGVFLDVIHGVFNRGDFFGVFIRNFNAEIFFKGHYQLDGVERIGAQVVHKGGGGSDFAFIHSDLLDDNFFHSFFDAGHSNCSSGIGCLEIPARTTGWGSAFNTTLPFYAGLNAGSTFDRGRSGPCER